MPDSEDDTDIFGIPNHLDMDSDSDDEVVAPVRISPAERDAATWLAAVVDPNFWMMLKNVTPLTSKMIGGIRCLGKINEPRDNISDGEDMYVKAISKSGGIPNYELVGYLEPSGDRQKVYFLNYKASNVTCVSRATYENENYDFFMTFRLDGCRFTLTKDHVLHVAADAGAGFFDPKDHVKNSMNRTTQETLAIATAMAKLSHPSGDAAYAKAREEAIARINAFNLAAKTPDSVGPSDAASSGESTFKVRRHSLSGLESHSQKYESSSIVFGVKTTNGWKYRSLVSRKDGPPEWYEFPVITA